jgi:hypothetical protein
MRVLIFSATVVWITSHSKKKWTGYDQKYQILQSKIKYPLFLSDFNDIWTFSTDFRKNPHISYFMKLRPVGGELFHTGGRADRRTDTTKLIFALRNFANTPKNSNDTC